MRGGTSLPREHAYATVAYATLAERLSATHRSVAKRAFHVLASAASVARVTLCACILSLPTRAGDLLTPTPHLRLAES